MPSKNKNNQPEKKRKIDWQRALVIFFGLLFIVSFILGSVARW